MTEQQVILQRQEKDQQEKVKASVLDKKKLTQLENQVEHLKKGKHFHFLLDLVPWRCSCRGTQR